MYPKIKSSDIYLRDGADLQLNRARNGLVSGNVVINNSGTGPYTVSDNIVMTAKNINYVYVGKKVGTLTYTDNVYYGGSTSKPSGDSNGKVVTALPVVSQSGYFTPNDNTSAGARLTIDTTPFLLEIVGN
jgi:hypothetical protein